MAPAPAKSESATNLRKKTPDLQAQDSVDCSVDEVTE
jgi:hypothetical protein